MWRISVDNKKYDAPEGLHEVSILRFKAYLVLVQKFAPNKSIELKEISRPGLFGWAIDLIKGKNIDYKSSIKTLKEWDEFNRREVGFWFQIPGKHLGWE